MRGNDDVLSCSGGLPPESNAVGPCRLVRRAVENPGGAPSAAKSCDDSERRGLYGDQNAPWGVHSSRKDNAVKILVAEDDSVTRRLLRVSLERWNYEVIAVDDGAQARDALLREGTPKLAILDWVMPGMDGIEICRELRRRQTGAYIYTLVLTSKREKGDLLQGLDAGADDFLIKPFDPLELQARLRSGCRIIELQDQLIAAREAMRDQATRDSLTTVWNRAAVMDILQRELIRSSREGLPLSLMMADLDHFKRINDSLGHQTGDAVLQEVARRIQSVLRPYDALGRYGGEEFLLIVPGCDITMAWSLAEKVRESVVSTPVLTSAGPIPVTLTLGVANFAEHSNLESLLRSADDALYRGKKAGRNRSELAKLWRVGSKPPSASPPGQLTFQMLAWIKPCIKS